MLHRAIERSKAVRAAATQNRLTVECDRLIRRRQHLVTTAHLVSEHSSQVEWNVLTQAVLAYHDEGELERKALRLVSGATFAGAVSNESS
jgi:hypothetical protein